MRYLYYSMSMSPVRSVSNILVVKPGAIGDLLQLTPVLRALKGRYPSSRITLLAGSGASVRLFQNNPHVYETLVYEKHGEHRQAASFLRLWAEIRKRRFDLVLNFQRSNLKIWLLTTAAFPCRVLVYHRSDRPGLHAVENYLETIEPLGISIATPGLDLELFPGQEDRSFADTVLKVVKSGTKPLIALNPGASHAVNRWDTAQFAELGNLLADRLGAKLVLIGGKEDEDLSQAVLRGLHAPALVLTGKTSLLQLGAVLEQCDILVTGDTGPMHVATALGTRVAALFGAADPGRTGPLGQGHRVIQAPGVACVPCRSRTCRNPVHLECMRKIAPGSVYEAIAEMLGEKPL